MYYSQIKTCSLLLGRWHWVVGELEQASEYASLIFWVIWVQITDQAYPSKKEMGKSEGRKAIKGEFG